VYSVYTCDHHNFFTKKIGSAGVNPESPAGIPVDEVVSDAVRDFTGEIAFNTVIAIWGNDPHGVRDTTVMYDERNRGFGMIVYRVNPETKNVTRIPEIN
jgi:hypothetical protein